MGGRGGERGTGERYKGGEECKEEFLDEDGRSKALLLERDRREGKGTEEG